MVENCMSNRIYNKIQYPVNKNTVSSKKSSSKAKTILCLYSLYTPLLHLSPPEYRLYRGTTKIKYTHLHKQTNLLSTSIPEFVNDELILSFLKIIYWMPDIDKTDSVNY